MTCHPFSDFILKANSTKHLPATARDTAARPAITPTPGPDQIKARWFVVPGSRTCELSGLRGEGDFEGRVGKESVGTLDYWFE
jgi:hypothetical protein